MEMIEIGTRKVVVRGFGKMFYQEGMPIGILAQEAVKKGFEISWLHVADELLKHGWSPETTYKKLREEMTDSGLPTSDIREFCDKSYEDQREMIFKYLFGKASNDPSCVTDPNIVNVVKEQLIKNQ